MTTETSGAALNVSTHPDVARATLLATSLALARPPRRRGNRALQPGEAMRHRVPNRTSTCFPFQVPPLRTAWQGGTTHGQSAAFRSLLEKFPLPWRGLELVGGQ